MSESDGKPYVFAWESNARNHTGSRIVKYRVCYPRRISKRWSKAFATEAEAKQHAEKVDGFGTYLRPTLKTYSATVNGKHVQVTIPED